MKKFLVIGTIISILVLGYKKTTEYLYAKIIEKVIQNL